VAIARTALSRPHGRVDPRRHGQGANLVDVGRHGEQRHGQHVAEHHAGQGAGEDRDHDLARIGRHDLGRGEADAFEDADPPVAGYDRAADDVDDDQQGQHQADDPEGDDERNERCDPRSLLKLDRQI